MAGKGLAALIRERFARPVLVVVPRVHADRASLAALLAVFGTTISPYLFFWQAGEEIEEQAERHDLVDRDHVAAMRLDVVAGMGSGVGVMFAIMTTAAVTLGAHGAVQVSTAQQAAQALRPLAGPLAGLLFAAGIVGTGYAVIAVSILVGVAMNFVGVSPIRALYLAAILNGVAAPPLLVLILLLVRAKAVLGQHRSGVLSQLLVGGAAVVMAVLSLLMVLP